MAKTNPLDDPRLHFNWGYHDARDDRMHPEYGPRHDRRTIPAGQPFGLQNCHPAYKAGYSAGYHSNASDTLSTEAWEAYQQHRRTCGAVNGWGLLKLWDDFCREVQAEAAKAAEEFGL